VILNHVIFSPSTECWNNQLFLIRLLNWPWTKVNVRKACESCLIKTKAGHTWRVALSIYFGPLQKRVSCLSHFITFRARPRRLKGKISFGKYYSTYSKFPTLIQALDTLVLKPSLFFTLIHKFFLFFYFYENQLKSDFCCEY